MGQSSLAWECGSSYLTILGVSGGRHPCGFSLVLLMGFSSLLTLLLSPRLWDVLHFSLGCARSLQSLTVPHLVGLPMGASPLGPGRLATASLVLHSSACGAELGPSGGGMVRACWLGGLCGRVGG